MAIATFILIYRHESRKYNKACERMRKLIRHSNALNDKAWQPVGKLSWDASQELLIPIVVSWIFLDGREALDAPKGSKWYGDHGF